VQYLNIGSNFFQPDGTISSAVLFDAVHPTLLGYQLLLRSIWPTMMSLAGFIE
jgi:hypothetical protein